MDKQCKQCGNYFTTQVETRQFCSHTCARKHGGSKAPYGTKIKKKLVRPDGLSGIACDSCGQLTFLILLELIQWNGQDKLVCPICLPIILGKCEEAEIDVDSLIGVQ